ncbi:SCO4225 family membrane protein [Streptomyces sp. NPDC102406]|uniref:SCO4225 family membrane protein n=1 Tax=Streptomyces sp. NPDC102406 TaxID=3366171 RepID=UPI003805303E
MSLTTTTRSLFSTATGNLASRVYLTVTAAVLAWAYVDAALVAQADSSFVGVYAIVVTAPLSVLLLWTDAFSALPFFLLIAVCALVNAFLIGLAARRVPARR